MSAYGVTQRFAVAKAPFFDTADVGWVSRVGWAGPLLKGSSLYAVGFLLTPFNFPDALEFSMHEHGSHPLSEPLPF